LVGSDLRADRSSKAARRKTRSPRRCDPTSFAYDLGSGADHGTENRRQPHQNWAGQTEE